jgi:hypothetical protein
MQPTPKNGERCPHSNTFAGAIPAGVGELWDSGWRPITSELTVPLVGIGDDGNPLSTTAAAAQAAYVNYIANVRCVS